MCASRESHRVAIPWLRGGPGAAPPGRRAEPGAPQVALRRRAWSRRRNGRRGAACGGAGTPVQAASLLGAPPISRARARAAMRTRRPRSRWGQSPAPEPGRGRASRFYGPRWGGPEAPSTDPALRVSASRGSGLPAHEVAPVGGGRRPVGARPREAQPPAGELPPTAGVREGKPGQERSDPGRAAHLQVAPQARRWA